MDNLSNIDIGLRLLGVGMITVFVILLIVVGLAKLIIGLSNRLNFLNDEVHPVSISKKSLDRRKIALITSVVQNVTNGTGRVKEIRKL